MKPDAIVGVRYVGKKDRQEDTICKTGAVWSQGQVHNFSESLAKLLLVHTDSFERATVAIDGNTFMSHGKKQQQREVAAVVNLAAMDINQMALFARLELGRVVHVDGKDEEQIRREVHSLMINNSLDEEAQRISSEKDDWRESFSYMATPEEAEALRAGTVVLRIVPAEVANFSAPEKPAAKTEPVKQENESNNGDVEAPTLDQLLASLDKKGLIAFAKQESIKVSNAMSEEKLREKIFASISGHE